MRLVRVLRMGMSLISMKCNAAIDDCTSMVRSSLLKITIDRSTIERAFAIAEAWWCGFGKLLPNTKT